MPYKWTWINRNAQGEDEDAVMEEGKLVYAHLIDCIRAAPKYRINWTDSWGGRSGRHLVICNVKEFRTEDTVYRWKWIAIDRDDKEIDIEAGNDAYASVVGCVKDASKKSHDVADSWGGPYLIVKECRH